MFSRGGRYSLRIRKREGFQDYPLDVRKLLGNSESIVITKYRCEDQQVLEVEEDSSCDNLGETTSSAKHLDDGVNKETEHDHKALKYLGSSR